MGRRIHSSYYEDTYIKHECQSCKRCFIVGEKLAEGLRLFCPYCRLPEIMMVAASAEDSMEDMGCLGLYYSLYDDGALMLYTGREFASALTDRGNCPSGTVMDCIANYCAKRDGQSTDANQHIDEGSR